MCRLRGLSLILLIGCSAGSGETLEVDLELWPETLPDGQVGAAYDVTLQLAGAQPAEVAWAVDGTPPGLSFTRQSDGTARLFGVPSEAGTFTVAVAANARARAVSRSYTLDVAPGALLQIESTSLPVGAVDEDYAATLVASGGSGTYAWRIAEGVLPPGLALSDPTGASVDLVGRPTEDGRFAFQVEVEDAAGSRARRAFAVDVTPFPSRLTLVPRSPAGGPIGSDLVLEVEALGGRAPFVWESEAPEGFTFRASSGWVATLEGPLTEIGEIPWTVRAEDADGEDARLDLTLRIVPVLEIETATLAPASQGVTYEDRVVATEAGGGHTWVVASGALPAGLSLSPDGAIARIAGSPAGTSSSSFTLEVVDALEQRASRRFEISVAEPLAVDGAPLPDGRLGDPYGATLAASGGRPPYTWRVASGALPYGIEVENGANAALTGTAGQVGSFPFDLEVTDADGRIAGGRKTIEVVDSGVPLSLHLPGFSQIGACRGLSLPVTASGGSRIGYAWRLIGAPPGISITRTGTLSAVIHGVTEDEGTKAFTVEVTDPNGGIDTDVQTLVVEASDGRRWATVQGAETAAGEQGVYVLDLCHPIPEVERFLLTRRSASFVSTDSLFSPDGRWLAVWGASTTTTTETLRLIDLELPGLPEVAVGPGDFVSPSFQGRIAFSEDGRWLLYGAVKVEELEPPVLTRLLRVVSLESGVPGPPRDLVPVPPGEDVRLATTVSAVNDSLSPDGRWAAYREDGPSYTIRIASLEDPTVPPHDLSQGGTFLGYDAASRYAVARSQDQLLAVDLETGQTAPLVPYEVLSAFFSPSRTQLLVVTQTGGVVDDHLIVDLSSGVPIERGRLAGSAACQGAGATFSSEEMLSTCITEVGSTDTVEVWPIEPTIGAAFPASPPYVDPASASGVYAGTFEGFLVFSQSTGPGDNGRLFGVDLRFTPLSAPVDLSRLPPGVPAGSNLGGFSPDGHRLVLVVRPGPLATVHDLTRSPASTVIWTGSADYGRIGEYFRHDGTGVFLPSQELLWVDLTNGDTASLPVPVLPSGAQASGRIDLQP